jgi:hypothetical protein
MLLLLADSLLLIFVTLMMGILTRRGLEKLFSTVVHTDLLGLFILGLISSGIYFECVSFFLPVNFYCLFVLLAAAIFIFVGFRKQVGQIREKIRGSIKTLLSPMNMTITLCMACTLVFFWIMPPANGDSAGYHYSSILWYETYKLVPGLGNIQGRLADNPAAFIVQSAYSFTKLTGQSLYPLNGVLVSLFLGWLLLRFLRARNWLEGLVHGVIIFLFYRILLMNISSPSPDTLTDICIAYTMLWLFGLLQSGQIRSTTTLIPALIILYALTAKLYGFMMLATLPFLFFLLPPEERKPGLWLKMAALGLAIYIPWIARNYVMSGYLVFPVAFLGLFHPDWQVPVNMAHYYTTITRHTMDVVIPAGSWSIPELFNKPLPAKVADSFRAGNANFLILLASLISPCYWLLQAGKRKRTSPVLVAGWLLAYLFVGIWILITPLYRFIGVYVVMPVLFPFLAIFAGESPRTGRAFFLLATAVFILSVPHYVHRIFAKSTTYHFTLADCWLYPLKDIRYSVNNNKSDFPYTTMRSGVKLYLEDSTHECLNTDLPCRLFYTGDIQMRGGRIEEGFKTVKDETLPVYPYIPGGIIHSQRRGR